MTTAPAGDGLIGRAVVGARELVTKPSHPAAERIFAALIEAQRGAGDAPICEALDLLAQGTGENIYRHCAEILRGRKYGREPINDIGALGRIAAYPAERRREAVGIVAKQIAGAGASAKQIDTIAHRLRTKMRERRNQTEEKGTSGILS
jgi:hypothetical protein